MYVAPSGEKPLFSEASISRTSSLKKPGNTSVHEYRADGLPAR